MNIRKNIVVLALGITIGGCGVGQISEDPTTPSQSNGSGDFNGTNPTAKPSGTISSKPPVDPGYTNPGSISSPSANQPPQIVDGGTVGPVPDAGTSPGVSDGGTPTDGGTPSNDHCKVSCDPFGHCIESCHHHHNNSNDEQECGDKEHHKHGVSDE